MATRMATAPLSNKCRSLSSGSVLLCSLLERMNYGRFLTQTHQADALIVLQREEGREGEGRAEIYCQRRTPNAAVCVCVCVCVLASVDVFLYFLKDELEATVEHAVPCFLRA